MIVEKIYVEYTDAKHTNKQGVRYSIHAKVVPFSGEEGNEQPSKQKEKEGNTDINNKQTSTRSKPLAVTVTSCRLSLLLSHISE